MAYWLVKSEPSTYSWDQLVKDKQTSWTGVRNYAARIHLKAMKKGEEVLFYHSNEGLDIVGIAKVAKEYYQDPTTEDDAWVTVDLKPFKKLKNPVGLARIKTDKRLANMALVRLGRGTDALEAFDTALSLLGHDHAQGDGELVAQALSGKGAAAGIASINAVGNLGGFIGPYAVGWALQETGNYSGGMMILAGFLLAAAVLVLAMGRFKRLALAAS